MKTTLATRPVTYHPTPPRRGRWLASLLVVVLAVNTAAPTPAQNVPSEPIVSVAVEAEAVVDVAPAAGVVPVVPAETARPQSLYERTLQGTVLIHVPNFGSGSGWVIDAQERLIVTNYHVVANHDSALVFFPAFKDGRLVSEMQHYLDRVRPLYARVIDSDSKRDLAVIQVDTLPETAAALPVAAENPMQGETVHSIGSPSGSDALFVYTSGTVRAVCRSQHYFSTGQYVDAMVVETQSPTNPGDSGGPVVNDAGEVVAVVSSGNMGARLISTFISVEEVHAYMAEVRNWLNPEQAAEFHDRGKNYFGKRRFGRAVADFDEAISLSPDVAAYYNDRGDAYYSLGHYDRALADFTQAIRRDKAYALAFSNRGWTFYQKGDYSTAVEDFEEAIRLDSTLDEAHSGLAAVHYAQGDLEQALASYTQAIRLSPESGSYYNRRGFVHYQRQDYYAAIKDYNEAIRLWPNNDVFRNNRGNALLQLGRIEEAIADYSSAIEIDPQYAPWRRDRGYAYLLLKALPEALADYNAAIELDPKVAEYYNGRGNVWFAAAMYEQALQDYTSALQLDASVGLYWLNRSNAWAKLGRSGEAQQDRQRAIQLDPSLVSTELKQHFRRKLQVVNNTGEPIRVYLYYYTQTANGDWAWYPGNPQRVNAISYTFEPGETSYLSHRDVQVKAAAVMIWAEGLRTGRRWDEFANQALMLVDEEGYMAAEMETHTVKFD